MLYKVMKKKSTNGQSLLDKIAAKIDCYGFKGIFTRLRDKYGQCGGFLAREEIGCGFHEQHDWSRVGLPEREGWV